MQFLGEALIWAAEDLWALILHITGRSSFPKPLCAAEEAEYIRRMGEGDASARDALIEHDLRLVAHIAKKYQGGALDADDLVSIGVIGLIIDKGLTRLENYYLAKTRGIVDND